MPKISNLPNASAATGTEQFPAVQGAQTRKMTAAQISEFALGPIGQGTAPDAGALTGAENATVSRGAGVLKTTLNAILAFFKLDFADATDPAKGAALVGFDGGTVRDGLVPQHADYAALRAYTGPQKTVYVTGYLVSAAPSGIAGTFVRDDSDTSTADNGITVIVITSGPNTGKRYKRVYSGPVFVDWAGAKGDAVTDDTAAVQAAINVSDKLRVRFSKGSTYLVSTLTIAQDGGTRALLEGVQSLSTALRHKDGVAGPLINVTGGTTGTPTPAYPLSGFAGLSFVAGNQTTALIYFEGHVDNQVKFHDLAFNGAAATGICDAISVRDYLNWNLRLVRFDAISGWAIKVRDAQYFSHSHFSMDEWTYDNGNTGTRGQGIFYIDCSNLGTVKGTASFTNSRCEINSQLTTAKPARALFRAVQNHTVLDGGGARPQVTFSFDGFEAIAATAAKDCKFISCDYRNVGIMTGALRVYGFNEFYNNDNYDAAQIPGYPTQAIKYNNLNNYDRRSDEKDHAVQELFQGINVGTISSDTGLNNSYFRKADIAHHTNPVNAAGAQVGGRPFAYKAVQNRNGICQITPATLSGTGSITTGTAVLTMTSAIGNLIVPGTAIDVPGAGAAGATLQAVIRAIDYATNALTLDTNASTTVSGATVTVGKAQVMAAEMITYSSGAPPASGAWAVGDYCKNTSFSGSSPVSKWECVTAGTPGTWRAVSWRVPAPGATASRPTLTGSDIGIMYLDTTLAAAGKPIWWTGTAWVDATGTAV